jgi:ribose 5-phosphate isomerase B
VKIAIGSDHRGVDLKAKILDHLSKKEEIECQDVGPTSKDSVDYPDYGFPVAERVSRGEVERGILICGSGLGMSYVANKVPGVIGALCTSLYQAEMSRRHNNANLLCLAADITPADEALKMLDIWLTTGFEGDRHERRVQKILDYEKQYNRRH